MYNPDTLHQIDTLLTIAQRHKNSYFWTPPGHAAERRAYEKRNSVELITWEEGGHEYTAEYTVSCSCKNVYAYGNYTRDGKRTTITAIRNSYLRMLADYNN